MQSKVMPPSYELRRLSMSQAKTLPVGMRIRWARSRKGMSHDALAAATGSTRSHLIKLEKGLHLPGYEMRARIAVATEQSADFFTEGAGDDDEEEAALARELIAVIRRMVKQQAVVV